MINLFEKEICLECGKPCNFGSGRFVNRIPCYLDEVEGFRCGSCQSKLDEYYEVIRREKNDTSK
jgi:hypothetical protein